MQLFLFVSHKISNKSLRFLYIFVCSFFFIVLVVYRNNKTAYKTKGRKSDFVFNASIALTKKTLIIVSNRFRLFFRIYLQARLCLCACVCDVET